MTIYSEVYSSINKAMTNKVFYQHRHHLRHRGDGGCNDTGNTVRHLSRVFTNVLVTFLIAGPPTCTQALDCTTSRYAEHLCLYRNSSCCNSTYLFSPRSATRVEIPLKNRSRFERFERFSSKI